MNRKDRIENLRNMLYCLQLIVTNEEFSYYFADVIVLDDFMVSLCNKLYSKNYETSNYLENDKYPYEFTDHTNKIVNQIILSSDNETVLEVFDSFEILISESPNLSDYSLYLTFLGIDSIKSLSSLNNSLRDYDFKYKIFGGEDLIESLSQIRDIQLIEGYESLVNDQAVLFSVLLNKDDLLLDSLLQVLTSKPVFLTSSPTIFPQSIKEYYENTAALKMHKYPSVVYENIIRLYNAYSRHTLGPRVCIGSVYSYIRQMWIRIGIEPDVVPYKAQQALANAILEDTIKLVGEDDVPRLKELIDAVIVEAFMRLKVDYKLYEF